MYINKSRLLDLVHGVQANNSLKNDILSLFEDQSKMTPLQVEKDVKKRLSAQTVGFEVEMYSSMNKDMAYQYITSRKADFPSLSGNVRVVYDGSLNLNEGDIYNDFDNDPVYTLLEQGFTYESMLDAHLSHRDYKQYGELTSHQNTINTEIGHCIELINSLHVAEIYEQHVGIAVSALERTHDISFSDYAEWEHEYDTYIERAIEALSKIEMDNKSEITVIIDALGEIDTAHPSEIYDVNSVIACYLAEEVDHESAHQYLLNHEYSEYLGSLRNYDWELDGNYNEYHEQLGDTYGIEVVTDKPISLRSADAILKDIVEVCNDENIGCIPIYDPDIDNGNTGLHIHFGITPTIKYNILDMYRLIINTHNDIDTVLELAERDYTYYSGSMEYIIDELNSNLDKLSDSYESNNQISTIKTRRLLDERYVGINMQNLARNPGDKNTIEFRWASSTVCKKYDSFKKYLDMLVDLVSRSFTGETTLVHGDYILQVSGSKEISSQVINVIKDGKLIGKIAHGNLNISGESAKSKAIEKQLDNLDRIKSIHGEDSQLYLKYYEDLKARLLSKRQSPRSDD